MKNKQEQSQMQGAVIKVKKEERQEKMNNYKQGLWEQEKDMRERQYQMKQRDREIKQHRDDMELKK